MVLPSARPGPPPPAEGAPVAAPAGLPAEVHAGLLDASLRLDGVEPTRGSTLRADEPAHRTATGRASSAVYVRPGWGGRPILR